MSCCARRDPLHRARGRDAQRSPTALERAVAALAARPGFRYAPGSVRRPDDPARWVLVSEWDGVGAWRRALSAFEVRVEAVPLLALAEDEPGAFEVGTRSTSAHPD